MLQPSSSLPSVTLSLLLKHQGQSSSTVMSSLHKVGCWLLLHAAVWAARTVWAADQGVTGQLTAGP